MAPTSNRRPGFSRRAQYGLFITYVIAATGLLVGLILLGLYKLDPDAFGALRSTVATATTPASSVGAWAGRGLSSIPEGISSYFGVRTENERLKKQLSDQSRYIQEARGLAYDNHRLKALLQLREHSSNVVVAARLVSSSASSTRRTALLNAGSWQSVHSGQPVRGPDGLIGRVLEVGPNNARVLLLTDAESIVPVRRTRDGLPAIVSGRGDGLLDIKAINLSHPDFHAGDAFITTGAGGIYPPGIPVARVIGLSHDGAVGQSFAEPDTLDFALVMQAFMPPPAQPPAR
jgi:rod shape-determining protein MreC